MLKIIIISATSGSFKYKEFRERNKCKLDEFTYALGSKLAWHFIIIFIVNEVHSQKLIVTQFDKLIFITELRTAQFQSETRQSVLIWVSLLCELITGADDVTLLLFSAALAFPTISIVIPWSDEF